MANLFVAILTVMSSCSMSGNRDWPLEDALALAGSNRPQLEAVLDYFADDSIGLEAAKFLIRNMPGFAIIDYNNIYLSITKANYHV